MRKTIATVIILGLVSIGYTAWPLYDLLVLVRAIETRDVHTVTRHVYFDAVRVSLTDQVVAAYVRRTGIKISPFAQSMAASALGIHTSSRRECCKIRNPYNSRNEIVGTTNKSIDAMPSAWLRRKIFQPCDGGRLLLAMYFATVVCPTSMPSLSSSPCIRGAPQSGLAMLMSRMSWRMSAGVSGRPPRGRDFQR